MDLVSALSADASLVCLVGAGGKKSTLYALAARLDRAVVTATVRIPPFEDHVAALETTARPVETAATATEWPLGLVPGRERPDRYRGYDPATVARLAEAHDGPVLVKADGARAREFKAPGDGEPQLPGNADVVVPVASAQVVGEPLTEAAAHRPERVAAITDLSVGDPVTAEAVGRVLASDRGGRKGVPDCATVVPLVNKVDDEGDAAVARDVAAAVHDRADVPRVVLGRMDRGAVVEVV